MKQIVIAAFFTLFALSTFAQGQGQNQDLTPEERAQKMTDHMKTELSLTDEQYKQVYAINLETAKRQGELEQGNQEQRAALKEEHMAQLEKVLTPDQMEKAKKMGKQRREAMRGGRGKKLNK